jgi:hypothetical protein
MNVERGRMTPTRFTQWAKQSLPFTFIRSENELLSGRSENEGS